MRAYGTKNTGSMPGAFVYKKGDSAFKYEQDFFEFGAHLPNDLLALINVHPGIIPGKSLARTANGKSMLVQ